MIATLWTVRLAAMFYAASLALQVKRTRPASARLFWTLGLAFYLMHVACAFQFHHGWRHSVAYQNTAQQTGQMFGLYWGGGLYLNYLFSIVWLADVIWWWRGYVGQPLWVRIATQTFLAFMFFNATVVFGRGFVRWCGLASVLGLTVLWGQTRSRQQKNV